MNRQINFNLISKECCLDHAVDEPYEVRGIFVVALISKDPWLVVQDVVIAVEDILSISHVKGNDMPRDHRSDAAL